MSWDVAAEPVRESPIHTPVQPGLYAGRDGFVRMVAEVLRLIRLLEASYASQESLLRRIDGAVRRKRLFAGVLRTEQIVRPMVITDYLLFNEYERNDTAERVRLLNGVSGSRLALAQAVGAVDGIDHVDPPPRVHPLNTHVTERLRTAVRLDTGTRVEAREPDSRLATATLLERVAGTQIDRIRLEITPHLVDESLTDLVATLTAVRAAGSVHLDQLFYALTIAEEAISHVQATGAETGELLSY